MLVTYAEYYLLFVRDRNNWAAWRHKLKEYKDKLVLLPVRIQAVQDKLDQIEQRNIST